MTPTFLSSDSGCIQATSGLESCPGQVVIFLGLLCASKFISHLRTALFSSYIGENAAPATAGRRSWVRDMLVLREWISVLGGRRRCPSAILDCRLSPCSGLPQGRVLASVRSGTWWWMRDPSPVITWNAGGSPPQKLQDISVLNIVRYCYCDSKCVAPHCPENASACHLPQINLAGLLCLLEWKQKVSRG